MHSIVLSFTVLAICLALATGCRTIQQHGEEAAPESYSSYGMDDLDAPVALGARGGMDDGLPVAPVDSPRPAAASSPGLSAATPSSPAFADAPRRFRKSDDPAAPIQTLAEPPVMEPLEVPAARVTHVNERDHYVILQCERMPEPGEDAQLFRNNELVGTIRFVSRRQGRYIVADIVSGQPARGDIARYKVLFARKAPPPEPVPQAAPPSDTDDKERSRGFPLFF